MSNTAADTDGRSAVTADASPEREDIAVHLSGVSKHFGDVTALHEAWLPIRRGELMTLLGPSGCGKTTLLNLVAGFFSPDGGEITIDGSRVNDLPTYKRQIGMMFQNYALFPHMSVTANVGYGLRMRGVDKAEIRERVSEALALVKLTGLEDRRPRQLSGGQQQRVALARALVIKPKVLLLDEPFSALDKNLRASMQVEVKEIQRKLALTTIFVTHDQSEALSLSDRVAVMSQGYIRQVGTPDEIYRRPRDRFVASFVGDTNILRARLDQVGSPATVSIGAVRLDVPANPLADLAPGSAVDLFLRPEQLRVAEAGAPVAATGTVAAQIYQGGHVDLYVDAATTPPRRVLVRLPGFEAMARWPVDSKVDLTIANADAVAFPPADD